MRKTVCLLAVLLCPAALLVAQNSSSAPKKNVAVCNSACIRTVNGVATCDPRCTDRSGHCVALDEHGNVTKVLNRSECSGITHQAESPSVVPQETEQQSQQDVRDRELNRQAP
jgi:hypothetical protein